MLQKKCFFKRNAKNHSLYHLLTISPYNECVNLLLNFCMIHISLQINGGSIKFGQKDS
jgi:hypothetical protein